jgi:hypothetical protein
MQRIGPSLLFPAVLLLASVLTPTPARADDEAAGRVLFVEASALMKKGEYGEACPKFEESVRQAYNINAHYFLAECREKQGKTATAWTTFLKVASKAKELGDAKREQVARKRAEALEPRLVRVRVLVAREVDGLEVRRDGHVVGRPMWNTSVPTNPDETEFTASAPGYEPFRATFSLVGEGKTVDVTIPSLIRRAVAAAPPEPQPALTAEAPLASPAPVPTHAPAPAAKERGSGRSTFGWVFGGVGVAALAGGGVLALVAKNSFDSAKTSFDGCDRRACEEENLQKEKSARGRANIATSLLIGGAVVAGVGVTLIIAGSGNSDTGSASASLSIHPTGLSVAGRF